MTLERHDWFLGAGRYHKEDVTEDMIAPAMHAALVTLERQITFIGMDLVVLQRSFRASWIDGPAGTARTTMGLIGCVPSLLIQVLPLPNDSGWMVRFQNWRWFVTDQGIDPIWRGDVDLEWRISAGNARSLCRIAVIRTMRPPSVLAGPRFSGSGAPCGVLQKQKIIPWIRNTSCLNRGMLYWRKVSVLRTP